MPPAYDPKSIAGKPLPLGERCQLLVIGAGPAGIAAAAHAAQLGLNVVLADENPVPATVMADDIPMHFGQRFSAAARNRTAMLEAFIRREPAIAGLVDAGVDVRLGTSVWGVYANGPSVGWLPGPVAGLQGDDGSVLLGCERVIVAAGRRDMGLAFPGWHLPGVLGITAAWSLSSRFGILDARRVVILGSATEALAAALSLREDGVEIAAIVEVAPVPVGPPLLVQEFADVPMLCGHTVRRVVGGLAGVEAVVVAPLTSSDAPSGPEISIDCDAVLLGVGTVPVVELLDAVGCRIRYAPERGGHVPVLDEMHRTSVASLYAAGDCTGIWAAKTLDPEIARAEGQRAAVAVAASLGLASSLPAPRSQPDTAPCDIDTYLLEWVRATIVQAAADPYVCLCEEVTVREFMELRPPRYLDWPDDRRNRRALDRMRGDGPPNPDHAKRLTRAGMGICQGRRCREQLAAMLALAAGCRLRDIPLASHRAPVRPLPLSVIAETQEHAEITRHWDTWFGMPSQYVPYWDAPRSYTVRGRPTNQAPEGK
jgi:thioredoxin reductase